MGIKKIKNIILGIAAFNHDASACIIKDDELIAFSEEERFNLNKHTADFPHGSINYCLDKAGLTINDVSDVAFYFNPSRCIANYFKINNPIFWCIDPSVLIRKRFYYEGIWLLNFINKVNSIKRLLNNKNIKISFINHHLAHVWYGYYSSGFGDCTVLSNDSIGEDVSSLAMRFRHGKRIKTSKVISQNDPHSLGYLYGAVTEFLGYKRGEGEGKVMAMASFGTDKYLDYLNGSIKLLPGGKFIIGNKIISRRTFQPKGRRLSMLFFKKFGKPRSKNEKNSQHHFDIAYSLQKITEKIVMHQINSINDKNIVLTGGVAQNSVLNGIISNYFSKKNIFVPPIPNDAGCSIGAAVNLNYLKYNKIPNKVDTAFLGSRFSDSEIINILKNNKIQYKIINEYINLLVSLLTEDKIIAIFRENMECGPRALGNRTILASPINPKTANYLNSNVKYREYFRPYGGFLLKKYVKEIFKYNNENISGPYMSFVYEVKKEWIKKIPSLVHVDQTSRVQIIEQSDNFLSNLLEAFNARTGVPILINTSFNTSGFPIARTPQDAISAFYGSAIDYLLFNDKILLTK